MSIVVDMATLLTSITTDIYYDDMPDTPANLIALYHSGGSPSSHAFGQQAPAWDNPTFQVRIRHTSAATALTRAESVKTALDGKNNTTIDGHKYLSVFLMGDILALGKDDKKRSEYALNFQASVQR